MIYQRTDFHYPARGGKCSNGGTVPNTAFIFRAFVATPRTLSYLCIFSLFYLALNLNIQVVNSPIYSITWNFLSKIPIDRQIFQFANRKNCLWVPLLYSSPAHASDYSYYTSLNDLNLLAIYNSQFTNIVPELCR